MAAFSSCIKDDEPENTGLKPGDIIPAFSIVMNTGETVSTASIAGKVAVIEFFNTSCIDCRRNFPVFQSFYDRFSGNPDVVTLAVAREEDFASISTYWEQHGLTIPFSPQPDRTIYNLFASTGIPRIFIVSPSGIISAAFAPDDNPSVDELAGTVILLLPGIH